MFKQKVKGIILDFKLFSFQGLYSVTKLHPWIICAGGSCHSWRRFQCFYKRNIDRAGNEGRAPGVRVVYFAAHWTGSSLAPLEWQSSPLSWHNSVQVGLASFFSKPVKPVDWHPVNSCVVDFLDWEGRDVLALIPTTWMAIGILFTTGLQRS